MGHSECSSVVSKPFYYFLIYEKTFIHFGLCPFVSAPLQAQELADSLSYPQYADSVTAELNPNLIPFGALYERVQPLANLDYYAYQNDSATSNTWHFFQSVHELHGSRLNPDAPNPLDSLVLNLHNYEAANGAMRHPLGILFAGFGSMLPWAVDSGLITTQDGRLKDLPGKNPYRTVHALVAAPLSLDDWLPGTHSIYLHPDYLLGNDVKGISEISIDFHDGQGPQTRNLTGLSPSQWSTVAPFTAIYDSAGDYQATLSLKLADNSIVKIYNSVKVVLKWLKKKDAYDCFTTIDPNECNDCITIGGIDGGVQMDIVGDVWPNMQTEYPSMGVYQQPEGRAYIFYANQTNYQQNKLRKPVLFIDGYDPTDSRCVRRIYSKYIDTVFQVNNQPVRLAEYIRSLGYDLVILDYKKGGSHLEQNAMVVKKLLETLYQQYGSGMEKDFVLIGPSMGALIAQFALGYMEKENVPHHVRTFISFDGPHKGANVAKGVTDLLNYLLGGGLLNAYLCVKIAAIKTDFFENASARQMLVHHPLQNSESPAIHPDRVKFLNHIAANTPTGYPQNCRNVAVINGNLSGTPNPHISSCNQYAQIILQRFAYPPLFLNGTINCEWNVHATTKTTSCKDGRFYTMWPLAQAVGIPAGWKNYYSQAGTVLKGLDASPGSYFGAINSTTEDDFKSRLETLLQAIKYLGGANNFYTNASINIANIGKTTFMPTISSVDYLLGNDMYKSMAGLNLTKCAGNTPFDRVYSSGQSTDHVTVNNAVAQAFVDEITGKYDGCPIVCVSKISSSNNITRLCPNNQTTLTLDNSAPSNSTVSWSVSAGLQKLAENSGSVTVKAVGNNQYGWVKAIVTPLKNLQPCSSPVEFVYNLHVGNGYVISFDPSQNNCVYTAKVSPVISGETYQWSTNGTNYSNSIGQGQAPFFFNNPQDNGITVYCKVTNTCGTVYQDDIFIPIMSSSNPCYTPLLPEAEDRKKMGLKVEVFPNPSETHWTVQIPNYLKQNFSLILKDVHGKTVFEQNGVVLENSNHLIANESLAPGVYILIVSNGKERKEIKVVKI